jgi:hypothetical protein
MADVTFPTTAVPGEGAYHVNAVANGALAQGQFVYKGTNKKMALAVANPALSAAIAGMVAETATANAPIKVQNRGRVTGLVGLTPGVTYYLSDTVPGALCLFADLQASAKVIIAGYAVSATEFEIAIYDTGVTL